jgi:hypothetical protein
MKVRRAVLVSLALGAVAGCRPQATGTSTALRPQHGPKAVIHATYTGAGIHRELRGDFTSERDAYVMVGHLTGDGHVRVLYPTNANQSGYVEGHKRYEIPTIVADNDASPSMYSLGTPPKRNAGAQMDSYDGSGHAFLFIITANQPLDFDAVSDDDGEFLAYTVPGYWYGNDPRSQIKFLADEISNGAPYSLEFANSFSSTRFTSLSDRRYDCAVMSGFGSYGYGYNTTSWIWNYFGNYLGGFYGGYDDAFTSQAGCGGMRSAYAPVYTSVYYQPAPVRPTTRLIPFPHPRVPDQDPAYRRRNANDANWVAWGAGHEVSTDNGRRNRGSSGDYSSRRSSSDSRSRSGSSSASSRRSSSGSSGSSGRSTSRPSSTSTRSTTSSNTHSTPGK